MPDNRGSEAEASAARVALEAAAFYDRWFPLVYRYFRRRSSDTETAEDLTAETFERIVKALPRFEPGPHPERSTRVWVYRIAGNVYKNSLRKREQGEGPACRLYRGLAGVGRSTRPQRPGHPGRPARCGAWRHSTEISWDCAIGRD